MVKDSSRSQRPAAVTSGYGHSVTDKDRAAWKRWHDSQAQEAFGRGTDAAQRGDRLAAVLWLSRAAHLARKDPNVIFAYAMALLAAGRWEDAAEHMKWVADRFIMRKAHVGRAIALYHLGRTPEAIERFAVVLSRYVPSVEAFPWAALFGRLGGFPGWCATSNAGVVFGTAPGKVRIVLDGQCVAEEVDLPFTLPDAWKKARTLSVNVNEQALYGSPIALDRIRQCQGFVTVKAHQLEGWIWYPADPDFIPEVILSAGRTTLHLEPDVVDEDAHLEKPLARPRRFSIPLENLPDRTEIVVRDRYGIPLTGSPLSCEAIALLEHKPQRPIRQRRRRPATGPRAPGFLVIVPVYRNAAVTRLCLDAVLADLPEDGECIVIDDASPEPEIASLLDGFAASGMITLVRHTQNRGFVLSVNAGLSQAAGRDVLLLNSDALIPPGGLSRLRRWLDCAETIGTVSPLSNDATILSYPSVQHSNPMPPPAEAVFLDRIFAAVSGDEIIDLPTTHGFCMGIRGDCLRQTGLMNVDLFAQGYGEENDFCCRASGMGWRHIAAIDLFVPHLGAASFGRARTALLERNLFLLNRLYPGYQSRVQAFIASDPLVAIRRRIGLAELLRRREQLAFCLVMVTHDSGGGVERVVGKRRRAAQTRGGLVLVIRPHETGCQIEGRPGQDDDLVFALPGEWNALIGFLKQIDISVLEWHHLLGHAPAMRGLADTLGLCWDIMLHDYIWFCPRICLVDPAGHYCGEPVIEVCETCIARQGSLIEPDVTVRDLVKRSAHELRTARRVIAASGDVQRRMARHFPDLSIIIEAIEPPPVLLRRQSCHGQRERRRICVPGAIGREKGFDILLQLARDAATRDLPLEYVVAGYTIDDNLLMQTGRVFVSGEFQEREAVTIIRSFEPDFGFIPSIWPETWCFALSNLWDAGLSAVSFDLGTQSERIRQSGLGVVVPLGMPIPMLNNLLLTLLC